MPTTLASAKFELSAVDRATRAGAAFEATLASSFWNDYQEAYEEMIQNTATKHAPWFVVPADNKWFTRLIVASAIIQALDELHLSFPEVDKAKKKELEAVRHSLLAQKE